MGTEYLFYPEALEERIREIAALTVDASGTGGWTTVPREVLHKKLEHLRGTRLPACTAPLPGE